MQGTWPRGPRPQVRLSGPLHRLQAAESGRVARQNPTSRAQPACLPSYAGLASLGDTSVRRRTDLPGARPKPPAAGETTPAPQAHGHLFEASCMPIPLRNTYPLTEQ